LPTKIPCLVGILEAIQIEGIAFFDTGFVSLHAVPGDAALLDFQIFD